MNQNNRRVVVTGLGAVSPIGNTVGESWQNLKQGVHGIAEISRFDTSNFKAKLAAEVKSFDVRRYMDKSEQLRTDRYAQYAIAAATQAVEESGIVGCVERERFGVYFGSGIGGIETIECELAKLREKGPRRVSPLFVPMMIPNMAAGQIAIRFGCEAAAMPAVTACASGSNAIGEALRAIRHGYADAIIAGGSEAAVHPLAIGGFSNSKALTQSEDPLQASIPFDARRSGFVIAEGAGIIILEEYEHAIARGAKIYAEVCGYGNTCDAHHYTAPRPDGTTQARAFLQALTEAHYSCDDLLHINAHGTSTPLNDKAETAAIKIAMGETEARRALISSTKSMTGHALGAAGGMEAVAAILALDNELVPPTIGYKEFDPDCDLDITPNVAREAKLTMALSSSLGFGGHNAVLAFRRR